MKRTTASGSSWDACVEESWPQSTRPVLEIPVARCGSRVTCTPAPWSASLRAISMSSGVESESPVTSSRVERLRRARHRRPPAGPHGRRARPGSRCPTSCWSGESQEVRSRRVSANGSSSETQPVGPAIALMMSRPSPGLSSSAAFRTAPPAKISSRTVVSVTALTASQALKRRRSQRSKRSIRLSSPCGSPSRPGRASASISAIVSKSSGMSRSRPSCSRGSAIRSGSR